MWIVLCAALALRLVTDLATPFMPGAFMLDESVTAAPSARATHEVAAPVVPPRIVDVAIVDASPRAPRARVLDAPVRWWPPRRPAETASHASDGADAGPHAALALA